MLPPKSDRRSSVPDVFQNELLKEKTSVKVDVPRGLRVPVSTRVAGQLSTRLGSRIPVKTYAVTVEPGGRNRLLKNKSALHQRSPTDMPDMMVATETDTPIAGNTIVSVEEQRKFFRRERYRRIQIDGQFPALLGGSLVPAWSQSRASGDLDSISKPGALSLPSRCARPTYSNSRKVQSRKIDQFCAPWNASGVAGANDRICDRTPGFPEEVYCDRVRCVQRAESDKNLWMAFSTILPPSSAEASVAFDSDRPALMRHLGTMRERGRAFTEELRIRYEELREEFKIRQPIGSPFHAHLMGNEVHKQSLRRDSTESEMGLVTTHSGQVRGSFVKSLGGEFRLKLNNDESKRSFARRRASMRALNLNMW